MMNAHRFTEIAIGTAQAALKIPSALAPCAVGGVTRALGGVESPEALAQVLDGVNITQVALGTGVGLYAAGVADVGQGVVSGLAGGAGAGLASRGGSNLELASRLDSLVSENISPEDGRLTRAWKGLTCGLRVGVVDGARVGYQEGQGAVRGFVEGASYAQSLTTENLIGSTAATLHGLACAPAGATRGLVESLGAPEPWRGKLATGLLTGLGVALGAVLAGPVGAVAGGMTAAAMGGHSDNQTGQAVSSVVGEFLGSRPRHASRIIDRNRDFSGGMLVGAVAAYQEGRRLWSRPHG